MIYFLQDTATCRIKIGFTADSLLERISDLQIGCPSKLILLLAIAGSERKEQRLHSRFAAARVRGEWFRPVPQLVKFIARSFSKRLSVQLRPESVRPRAESKYSSGELRDAVLSHLRTHPPSFVKDISLHLKAHSETVRTALYRLRAGGLVRREGKAWTVEEEKDVGVIEPHGATI